MQEIKLALVLSGGSIRGAAHVGAIKTLERYNLIPDVIAGTSAGSIVGGLYGAGASIAKIEAIFLRHLDRTLFLDTDCAGIIKSVLTLNPRYFKGLYLGRKFAALVNRNLKMIRDSADFGRAETGSIIRPTLLSAVNLADGQETIFAPPSVAPRGEFRICTKQTLDFAIHCSCAIPGTFVPVVCDTRPGCPCDGKGRQYYVDGGVRDMYPITLPVRLMGAKHIIGVNLGYAGMREDIWRNGPAEYFGHVIDIMGNDQEEADYMDYEVRRAQVLTVNPLIYDVGAFEAQYIPALIERGGKIMEECLRRQGLTPGAGRETNLARLFPRGCALIRYPAKGSWEFDYWLKHPIKIGNSPPRPLSFVKERGKKAGCMLGVG